MKFLKIALLCMVLLGTAAAAAAFYGLYHYGRGLPDYRQLAEYKPPVVTRVHAGDGRLMAEFARERRVFVPVRAMPKLVIRAFLSAEDKTFYSHFGIDPPGIVRAAITNLLNIGTGRRAVGASTITQQVAKNFLVGNELSITRKIQEIILAFRIERAISKDRILELYLNEIYLGFGSYGVAAAALNYFDKSLDDLTLPEAAFLAGLPKAPANYHPLRHPRAARARRNYVLSRMAADGHVPRADAEKAMAEPVAVRPPSVIQTARADYFVEEVRRELAERYGENTLYGGGLSVRSTLSSRLQEVADTALRAGLTAYDRRRGWRGPLGRVDLGRDWRGELDRTPFPDDIAEWRRAAVLEVRREEAWIGFSDGSEGRIPLAEMRWARALDARGRRGPKVAASGDVLKPGDAVAVEKVARGSDGKTYPADTYGLRQIPEANGGLVAIDPHTGRVLAMSGGFSAALSSFNRVTQASRQPGSAFKPIVYLAALESGFTPSSLVLDAPFVMDMGPGLGRWRPENYARRFYGPSTLRVGIERSRNLMTVRLARDIGMEKIAAYAEAFGVVERMPQVMAMALGSGETTLLRLTAAYAMLVNGGRHIRPTLIDRIQDRNGATVFRHDRRDCPACRGADWDAGETPGLPDEREAVADPRAAYQVVSMLEGAVRRGTGRAIRSLGRPLAGKTGTTNESRDAWFVGFSPDLAVGVFVGYDRPRSLGRRETGASVAVPIFRHFMEMALADEPAIPFRVPPGVLLVRVDPATGVPAAPGAKNVILEAFLPGTVPLEQTAVLDGSDREPAAAGQTPPGGSGRLRGLY